jgi:DNA-binding transcriptional MocR family regulator
MTPADEARFIQLWQQGASYAAIAQALGCPQGAVSSRAAALPREGKIQARPRGGTYPRQKARGRSEAEGPPSTVHPGTVDGPPSTVHRPPSTVHPDTWELKQLKHSVRWTVYVPQAMREELQRRAAARGQNPSLLVQEALARWLAEEA